MSELTIEAASEQLYRLAIGLADRTGANQKLSVSLEEYVLRNFQSEGALRGGWEPLKLSTILARLRKASGYGRGGSKGLKLDTAKKLYKAGASRESVANLAGAGSFLILQDTGHLRQSFAGFFDNDQAGVGTSDSGHPDDPDIALMHEEGRPDRNLPARPMLPTQDQALEIAVAVYEEHIAEARAKAGFL